MNQNKLEIFDSATLTKLEIFEKYVETWLPVFLQPYNRNVYIFDFFAGAGMDKKGKKGSPLRILDVIHKHRASIFKNIKTLSINVVFNEKNMKLFSHLEENCEDYLSGYPELKRALNISLENKDFEECFKYYQSEISANPTLVFIDQYGIKFINKEYLTSLTRSNKTDFLYFVSSSYFYRFGGEKEFKQYLDIDWEEIKSRPYRFIHKTLIEKLRKKALGNSKYMLYPFSLKKNQNIHGIIFGTSNELGAEKFLDIVWNMDPLAGEANFDINEEIKNRQLNLWKAQKPSKKEFFQKILEENILKKNVQNNIQAYEFALKLGHPPKHAKNVVMDLKSKGKIDYEGTYPCINYSMVRKKNRLVELKLKNS